MAAPTLIDLSNYDTLLVQSTQSRSGTPDGNIFFDVANGRIELITAEELANVDLGSGSEANPLTNQLGIRFEAIYAFENQERRTDESLRQYDRFTNGSFKFAGAYNLIFGRKFDDANGSATSTTTDDRNKIRGSGFGELSGGANGTDNVSRIYFGAKGLSNIESASQPYFQQAVGGAPTDFAKAGQFDEPVQVLGSTSFGDANAGNFDFTTYLAVSIRTFGFNYDRKESTTDLGIAELGGYSSGFAVNETPHNTSGAFTLADVYGGSQIAPWTGMTLTKLASPQAESGFNEADGNFTWVLSNANNGTLAQCVAFLDALAQTDDDIDSGGQTVTNGKRVGTWYSYNGSGQVVFNSPVNGEGLFVENIPTADEQACVFVDDAAGTKTRPFTSGIQVTVGANAVADVLSFYHAFFLDGPGGNDYGTANALTVQDNASAQVKGNVSTDQVSGTRIDFGFDYDGDTIGGSAGTDKDVVFICEGDGGVTAAKTVFTISRAAVIPVSCVPTAETNV